MEPDGICRFDWLNPVFCFSHWPLKSQACYWSWRQPSYCCWSPLIPPYNRKWMKQWTSSCPTDGTLALRPSSTSTSSISPQRNPRSHPVAMAIRMMRMRWRIIVPSSGSRENEDTTRHAVGNPPQRGWMPLGTLAGWWGFCLSNSDWVTPCGVWKKLNSGPENGLLPDNTKPLPEPMLTYRKQSPVAFITG